MTNNLKSEADLKSEAIADLWWQRYRAGCNILVNSEEVKHCINAAETLNELDEWKQCENAFLKLIDLDGQNINSVEDFKKLDAVKQYLEAFKNLSVLDEAKNCLKTIENFNKLDPETKHRIRSPEFYMLPPNEQISMLGDWFFYCDALMTFQMSDKCEYYRKKYPEDDVPLKTLQACNNVGTTHRKFTEWQLVANLLTVVFKDKNHDLKEILHIVLQFILEIPGKEYLGQAILP